MTAQYIFDAAGFLTGIYEGPGVLLNSTHQEPIYTDGFTPQFVNGAWIDQGAPPVVSPVQFKLLFTPQERVAMKAARATDPVIADLFELLDDPRLTFVDLGLQSTKDAVAYLVFKELITQARGDEVLLGVLR